MNKWKKLKHFLTSRTKLKHKIGILDRIQWQNTMAQLSENKPVYGFFFSWIKNYQVKKSCVIMFVIRKGKTGNLVVPSLDLYLFLGFNYPILGKAKALYSCTVDCDWRGSRLPWLDTVLLCLVRVWLEWVSRAVPAVVIEPYFTPSNQNYVLWANLYGQKASFNLYWPPGTQFVSFWV